VQITGILPIYHQFQLRETFIFTKNGLYCHSEYVPFGGLSVHIPELLPIHHCLQVGETFILGIMAYNYVL
jgi:hypothetical protein